MRFRSLHYKLNPSPWRKCRTTEKLRKPKHCLPDQLKLQHLGDKQCVTDPHILWPGPDVIWMYVISAILGGTAGLQVRLKNCEQAPGPGSYWDSLCA